ncbi:MAG TPA: family 78 glycoside hydrolase catalytic domain [Verrucomicrobiae bacterium]|nr:family 78 glycoside hydrolase catalytic domain [Verrucomicrobiae bacterium]
MRITSISLIPILALVLTSVSLASQGRPSAPTALLVNGVRNPLAIDGDGARFTWKCEDSVRGEIQTAYEILVSPNIKSLDSDTGGCWDSGKADSGQSASVEYAGKPLPSATRFWWKVRVWDQTGKPGAYSAPARFDTGITQWKAQYIWDGTTNQNNFTYFRKTISIPRKPALAKIYVTAHNDYLLYFNGQLLGRGPARCDPVHYGQYNSYDITKLVEPGSNVFAAVGHWLGTWNDSGVNAKPAFLLEARFDYPDGSSSTVGTDNSWKVLPHTAFIETNATYFGGTGGSKNRAAIQFDSRLEPPRWREIGFDDLEWNSATVVDRSNYHLFAQMAPCEREQAELKPVSIILTNGGWLVDFGRCIDGWPKLTMRANHSGDIVRVEYFEMTDGRMPAGWDEYICHGGVETWDPDFGRHTSFQMVRIIGYAGKLDASDVRGVCAYCDADVAGRFQCSSPLLNAIYEMCERSARQNVQQGIISVDANREQSPWTADSWNIGNVLLYNDRNTTMIDKIIRDYAAEQFPNGDFPACCPAHRGGDYTAPGQKSRRIPEWSMYWPMLLWQQYLFSGDDALLRQMAPRLKHFLDWIKAYQNPQTSLLDPPGWRISDYAGGNMPGGGYNIATTCQYYENLTIASRIYSALGQTSRSDEYLRQAQQVKDGINASLFNGQYYLAKPGQKEFFPLACAWPLRFDIESESAKSQILDAIEKAGKPDIGGYGGDAFYSGLLNAGGGDFVVRDLARYRPMLEENKANWERFDTKGEVNHAWTSYPAYLFLKYICGIQPTSGAFATFDVRPDTGGLSFAEGAVPTVKGLITVRWEQDSNGGFLLSVHVPPNTRASIYIPERSTGDFTVTESGNLLWPATSRITDPGVLGVSQENSGIKCLVASGDYRFVSGAKAATR